MSRQWLVDHVVAPYWLPAAPAAYQRLRDPSIACHSACNLAVDWCACGWTVVCIASVFTHL